MLAVLNLRMPLAQLGQAAQVDSPSAAIEPAVAAGLVDWSPDEATCPVEIRRPLVRDAIYAGITPTKRRMLHAWAASMVSESASWEHRVASLECPDEGLAAQLEQLAGSEAAAGRLALAATHLHWASDVSPARADRERRLLTTALHLVLAEEARGLALREAVEATAPSPLRSCVLGTMAFSEGRLIEAERRFNEALAEARDDPDSRPLAALTASRLADTYTLLGEGEKAMTFGRWALGTGCLDPAAASQTRTRIAIAAAQLAGPGAGLAELGHLDADPARVDPVDVDGLAFRGVFRLLAGDLGGAMGDLRASLKLACQGATLVQGLRAYGYLALAQYLAGAWDDVLLTAEQGFSAAAIHSRLNELPLLHLAAGAVPAGRGAAADAERHARLAEEAAASRDHGHERLYAAMARALACQASADYLGMADALSPWQDEAALDGRTRLYAVLWRPLLAEGLIGSGQLEQAAAVLARLRADSGQVSYLAPALAWLDGWLAEQRGAPERGPGDLHPRRGHRQHAQPGVHGPAAAGPRPAPAAHREQEGRGPAPAPGQRPVPGVGRRAVPRPDRRGAGGLPPSRQPGEEPVCLRADQPGDRSGAPGREGAVQPRGRGRAVHQPQGRGIPPGQHLRQMRRAGTAAAAAPRRAAVPAGRGLSRPVRWICQPNAASR